MNAPALLDFDAEWYLQSNPDVAAAGIDPWTHYQQSGRAEGRLGVPVRALELDRRLWTYAPETALAELQELAARGAGLEQACAGWALGRWHAARGEWPAARQMAGLFHQHPEARRALPQPGPFLLAGQAAARCGRPDEAQAWAERLQQACGAGPELDLLDLERARLRPAAEAEAALREALNRLYERQNLSAVTLAEGQGCRFGRLRGAAPGARPEPGTGQPLISVVMPVHNGEATLDHAIAGVLAQDWGALELIVVDDASGDGSLRLARGWEARDSRVRVLETGSNIGAYGARNLGMAAARGAFLTVHDADDWPHPSKLRLQAAELIRRPELKASVSHWVRADGQLAMSRWRIEADGWVHRNVSSLMIRAGLRESLGYWDRVRFNADTEYYYRLIAAFGAGAIAEVMPGVPLAWGRSGADSLTGRAGSHASTHLWGVRKDYLTAAQYWHAQAQAPEDLYMPAAPELRPFRVPAALQPAAPAGPETDYDRLAASRWFDPAWYLSAHRDVERSGQAPALHYLASGMAEERDPGPEFSASGCRQQMGLDPGQAALLHWHAAHPGAGAGAAPVIPRFEGRLARRRGRRVLVCAHAAGGRLFGAERSFLDMLRRLRRRRLVPVVVVPGIGDPAYLDALKELSAAVVALPQAWRRGLRPPDPRTVALLRGLIRDYGVRTVHVNTLVLDAPLAAARAEGCESVVHVRELPAEDPPLCRALELGPDELRARLLQEADRFVANAPLVAEWLGCPERTEIQPNRVSWALFRLRRRPPQPVLRAGLISSNISKKGIADAAAIGQLLAEAGAPVEILLIGPWTQDLNALAPLPQNVQAPGYAASTAAALEQVDVVLSLSHFAESFGRTVLEAMAAGRPVLCYGRGMPPRLVQGRAQGRLRALAACGWVVPPGGVGAAAEILAAAAHRPRRLRLMSRMARLRAAWLNLGFGLRPR